VNLTFLNLNGGGNVKVTLLRAFFSEKGWEFCVPELGVGVWKRVAGL
jgi:hypothetical protein